MSRLADAQVLLRARRYAGAYYMAGYAVECALKACIAQQFKRQTVPPKKLVDGVYQHDLTQLLGLADLSTRLGTASGSNLALSRNWDIVKGWRVESRYSPRRLRAEAHDLVAAVSDPNDGVLRWIQAFW
jgi:HEPN domain-containing protein